MRFNEIVDLRYYTLTDTDLPNILEQMEELWPGGIADDDVPFAPDFKRESGILPVERKARAT
jgi:hypothetical protein